MPAVPTSRRPRGAAAPTDPPPAPSNAPVRGAADVLCDGTGRIAILSYQVPRELTVRPGDAVDVPFGKRTVRGMVLGPGDPGKATRPIAAVHGKRATPAELALARTVARHHFSDLATVYRRLAPTTGRGGPALDAGPVHTHNLPAPRLRGDLRAARRLLLRAPLLDPAALAAAEAARIHHATGGQVLILAPTAELVTDVLTHFATGAARLDGKGPKGAWLGFAAGTVTIGVGTRAAAMYSPERLGGIVVVEEDHPGHREARQPYTHARDLASARTRAHKAHLSLISAQPTPAALGAGVAVITAGTRTDWPTLRVIDRSRLDPVTRMAPPQLKAAIDRALRAGHAPVVLVQRKEATRRCPSCSAERPCPQCTSSLCRHRDPLPCPHCNHTAPARITGWDAERVTDLLGTHVRTVTLAELTDTRDAGLVILFDLDAATSVRELIPDTLATTVIIAAATAAGAAGTVLALTDHAEHPLIDDLFTRRDQAAVAVRALENARTADLPPFGRVVTVHCGQKKEPDTSSWAGRVLGPRRSGNEWEILVRIPAADLLDLAEPLTRLRRGGKTRISVT